MVYGFCWEPSVELRVYGYRIYLGHWWDEILVYSYVYMLYLCDTVNSVMMIPRVSVYSWHDKTTSWTSKIHYLLFFKCCAINEIQPATLQPTRGKVLTGIVKFARRTFDWRRYAVHRIFPEWAGNLRNASVWIEKEKQKIIKKKSVLFMY